MFTDEEIAAWRKYVALCAIMDMARAYLYYAYGVAHCPLHGWEVVR